MKKLPEDQQVDFLRTIVNCNIRAIVERDEKVRIDLGWREPRHAVFTIYVAHTDVGFVDLWGCIPNCSFYDDVFSRKPQTSLTSQFRSKYLIDVDGHSFSGRWHAFLQSRSLGFKATIFPMSAIVLT